MDSMYVKSANKLSTLGVATMKVLQALQISFVTIAVKINNKRLNIV